MTMALLGSWKIHSSSGERVRESESESDVGGRERKEAGSRRNESHSISVCFANSTPCIWIHLMTPV